MFGLNCFFFLFLVGGLVSLLSDDDDVGSCRLPVLVQVMFYVRFYVVGPVHMARFWGQN